jgi:hypothetical protein
VEEGWGEDGIGLSSPEKPFAEPGSIMDELSPRSRLSWRDWLVVFLILGYLSMSRSFAYLGVRPFFIGEVALAIFLISTPGAVFRPGLGSLLQRTPLSGFCYCLYLSLVFGALQCLRGFVLGHHSLITVQTTVFHTYALYFFVGLWVGRRHADFLPKIVNLLVWWHGFYAIAYILVLSQYASEEEPTEGAVSLFGQPYGAAVALLGILCYASNVQYRWLPFLLNGFAFVGMQVRAAWLGFMVCFALWASLVRRLLQAAVLTAVLGGMFLLASLADLRIPSPAKRGGEISARALFARAIAPVDPDWAAELSPEHSERFVGTVSWRTVWWRGIWRMVHESHLRAAIGPGYGYPIWESHPDLPKDRPLRTPHNIFMFALGYTGWMGVAIFYALQLSLGCILWRVYRRTGQPFGICYWMMILVWMHFDNFMESPFGAIPFYLLTGLCAASALGSSGDAENRSRSERSST